MLKFKVAEVKFDGPDPNKYYAILNLIQTDRTDIVMQPTARYINKLYILVNTPELKTLWESRIDKEIEIDLTFN
jgi:hypothetical protein